MSVLLVGHPRLGGHETGEGHVERPARLEAVAAGIRDAALGDEVVAREARPATMAELAAVHDPAYLDALERFCAAGGGTIDADTVAGTDSFELARLAAGGVLSAVEGLRDGGARAAFVAVRPPGHHATPVRAMGFCLLNNVAVGAAALAARGERVLIVDFDVHHGNGTQDAFWRNGDVVYVSMHEHPLYPGTGGLHDAGAGPGRGATVNLPFPPGTTGDAYRAAVDEVVAPLAQRFEPDWLLLSAGFDAHRRDPLAGMALTSGDFGDLTARLASLVEPGRTVAVLEGGYDLRALADSAGACVAALAGRVHRPEALSGAGPGRPVVEAAAALRSRLPAPGELDGGR